MVVGFVLARCAVMELADNAKFLCVLTVGFGDLSGTGAVAVDHIWW